MDSASEIRRILNEDNLPPKPFTEQNLIIGIPSPADGGVDYNSTLPLDSVPGRGYYGSDTVFYKRIPLDAIDHGTPLRTTAALTRTSIIELLNGTFNLFLIDDDLEEFEIPPLLENQNAQITIQSKSTSLGFINGMTFTIEYGRAWLDVVVRDRMLSQLNHPDVLDSRLSARMLTWSKDFTSLRDVMFRDVKTGTYTDPTAFIAACVAMGIPLWGTGPITDIPTSSDPAANQAFDRAIIQRGINTAEMVGDLYFHYNNLEEI